MKKELREIIEPKIQILSERKSKDGSMTILAPWIQADRSNKNGRLYPLSLLQREVKSIQDRINSGAAIGSADHPAGAHTTLEDASHIIQKLEIDKDGKGWMEAKILPTSKGKNVIEIINAGGQLGISARGAGTVSPTGIVTNDYKLLGIDLCTNPSEPTAVFNKDNVFESAEFEENLDTQQQIDLEESISDLEKQSFLGAVESGFKGTEIEWHKMYGGGLREMVGLPVSGREIPTEKLTEGQISARTHSYYVESVQAGYSGTFDEWKEKFPQIVESASKVKVVEKKVEKKEKFVAKMSLAEAHQSGFVGTIAEWREQHPDIELILPAAPQEKVVAEKILTEEALKQEAARIFTALSDNPNSSLTLEDVKKMLQAEEEKKTDKRIRRKAIQIVSNDISNSGGNVSQEQIEKMVKIEIERLTEQRKLRREKNWQVYRKLLSD